MNWNRIITIARWEYMQKVRSKAFVLSLLLTPILIVGLSVLPTLLIGSGPGDTNVVGLVDESGKLFTPLKQRVESNDTLDNGQPAYLVSNYLAAGTSIDSAIARADRDALAEVIEGTFVVRDSADKTLIQYRSPNPSNIRISQTFQNAAEHIITERRLAEEGVDTTLYNRLRDPVNTSIVKITAQGKGGSTDFGKEAFLTTFFAAFVGIILLMVLILTTGQSLMRSLVEEKSNRIMEMLVSSSTPQELMWGKLLGLSGLGATQALSWVVLGVASIGYFNVEIAMLASLPLVLVYLVIGYFFYSAIFIGVGSLITTEQEAQVMTSYLSMLLVAPMAFAVAVMQNPDATYVKVLSFIPLLTPSVMMLRIVTKMPPVWEIAATIAVLLVSTILVTWVAAKIFRTAILLYGKRPTLGEVMRWMRA